MSDILIFAGLADFVGLYLVTQKRPARHVHSAVESDRVPRRIPEKHAGSPQCPVWEISLWYPSDRP